MAYCISQISFCFKAYTISHYDNNLVLFLRLIQLIFPSYKSLIYLHRRMAYKADIYCYINVLRNYSFFVVIDIYL
ncbi:MAG: hypothetical protein FWG98_13445, partial [Candidatus Cloacimonetes bacterium]|nr:hypothetical protein [Candidatus Cloacimonadota bacterium]